MPEIFNFLNATKWEPSVSDIFNFLASLPEQQKNFEYTRSLLIKIVERFSKIANPNIIKIWWIILSNKTMIELLLLNSNPDKYINLEKLVSIWEKVALDTFRVLLMTKPFWRLGDSNLQNL
jgi:hypothetical protein